MATTIKTTRRGARAIRSATGRTTKPSQSETGWLQLKDLIPRSPEFFGLSAHASDRAARAQRRSLAYQPI